MLATVLYVFLFALAAGVSSWGLRRRLRRHFAICVAEAEKQIVAGRLEAERQRAEGDERSTAERERLAQVRREDAERQQTHMNEYAAELDARDALLDARDRAFTDEEAQLTVTQQLIAARESETRALATATVDLHTQRVRELEVASGQTVDEVRAQLVRDAVEKVELNVLMQLRETEAALNEAAAAESRRVMQVTIERYDGASHLERVQNSIPLTDPQSFAALLDPTGPCRVAFLEEVGCELVLDEAQLMVTVRGDDPLAREVARRVLRQVDGLRAGQGDKLRSLARLTKAKVDREVQNAGRKAIRTLGIGRMHPDVLHLIGRLKFRLSYSQNQWRHSIEVAQLAGLLAAELGLDVAVTQRGGLLHDIGKAMTHDHDGSHALLGAEVARRCGEDEVVVNAIASHHNDEAPRTPIALIVTAADALSGGRPGARRESVTQYLNRIQDIQRIAGHSPAGKRVDIMQAGREVRVVVAGTEQGAIDPSDRHCGPSLREADLQPLAQEIARRIQDELTFAGQIKVTVIRESRSVAVAH